MTDLAPEVTEAIIRVVTAYEPEATMALSPKPSHLLSVLLEASRRAVETAAPLILMGEATVLCAGCRGFGHCDGREPGCDCTCGFSPDWADGMNGDELLAFLAARLDEDAVAATRSQSLRDKLNDPRRRIDPAIRNGAEYIWREAAVDPERMLREVDAKRAILDRHRNCDECPCDDVRDVASVYRGHPDFDSGWLPRRPAVTG